MQLLKHALRLMTVVAATGASFALQAPSGAQAMWGFWDGPRTGVLEYSQNLTLGHTAPTTFWSSQFNFQEQPESGGYVGVQVDGYAFDQGVGEIAIFSLWNATKAYPSPGAVCGPFGGEGEGLSCRTRMAVKPGHEYQVRVVRVRGTSRWTEFRADVRNLTDRTRHPLGTIRVPGRVTMGLPANFIEYFGTPLACSDRPRASARFAPPRVVLDGEAAPRVLRQGGFAAPACSQEIGVPSRGYSRISTGR
jgi:hypothetical protein